MKRQSPFSLVTASAALTLVALFALLIPAFLKQKDPLFAWATALLLVPTATLVIAQVVAARRQSTRTATWILVGGMMTMAMGLPLLLADFVSLAPLVLLMVPLSVCISGRLRYIPIALVVSLLSMAGALGFDLYAPMARPAVFDVLAVPIWMVVGVFCGQILVLGWAAWFFRVRVASPFFTRINIASQQALITTGVAALAILLTTAVLASRIREAHGHLAGEHNRNWATILAERIADDLEEQLNQLQTLSQDPAILSALKAKVAGYPEDPQAVTALIDARDQHWRQAAAADPVVMEIRSNDAMMALARFRRMEHSHNNMLVTDRFGSLVAAQGRRPDRYSFRSLPLWRRSWNRGIGSSYFEWDTAETKETVTMGMAIWDQNTNEALGVIVTEYYFRPMLDAILLIQQDRPLLTAVIDAQGREIARHTSQADAVMDAEGGWAWMLPKLNKDASVRVADLAAGWLQGRNEEGQRYVIGHAPLSTTSRVNLDAIRRLGWRVVVAAPENSAFIVVTRTTKTSLLVAMVILAASVGLASVAANVMVRPIGKLKQTATAMVAGDLNRRADPVGSEEMATLAEAFNSMTAQLRSVIESLQENNRTLEDKVRERTARLRRTQRGLIDGAHSSGMAEIATGVLHNIGNILNSLNVSVETCRDLMQHFEGGGLKKLRHLLTHLEEMTPEKIMAQQEDWPKFQQYLQRLVRLLEKEQNSLAEELGQIHEQARLIHKSLVAQSDYAREVSYSETLDLNEVINDILLADTRLEEQFRVHIHREFVDLPPVQGIRSKLSYAFLCLVENACEAMTHLPPDDRRLTIKTLIRDHEIHVSVRDNGIGIPHDRLNSIFQYGFTTKPDGNGFGLHSCANAMREMGGRVLVDSEGEGRGAIFTLALVLDTDEVAGPSQLGAAVL
ncbi:ATP-binding protein [Acanthopleuribacter pedis]|uniref:histidine kinase n=1 Tax=Acanthopleuribacter pedis TaxID=442870 RepID=A0A8J7PZM0_9BACT|nr:HAMP domain-containing protein [Acanthopleuribacter pedis]